MEESREGEPARRRAAFFLPPDPPPAAASSAAGGVSTWRAHLQRLFATHGILHTNFMQQQLQAANATTGVPMHELHSVLSAEAQTFGPLSAYWMETKRGAGAAQRATAAGLFSAGSAVTVAQVKSAFPRATEEKRRDVVGEFATFQVGSQTWQLKSGMP